MTEPSMESNGDAKRQVNGNDDDPSSKRIKVDDSGEEATKGHSNDNDASESGNGAPSEEATTAPAIAEVHKDPETEAPSASSTAPVEEEAAESNEAASNGDASNGAVAEAPQPTVAAPAPKPTPPVLNASTAAANGAKASALPAGLPRPADPNVSATLMNPTSIVEERGEVSALYVGRVIGKGGEMIRDLQARSSCRIDVDQNVPAGQPRVITYRGTRKTVDFAKRLVQMLCAENASEATLPLGEAKREFLVVPAQSVGKIIGRGGEMIRELQSRSQAKIQVDHSGASGLDNSNKQVTMTGTEQAVAKAREMVLFLVANPLMDAMQAINMLVDDKVQRGGVWGSGPPYPGLMNQGRDMQPAQSGGYGGYEQQAPYYGGAPGGGHPGGGYGAPVAGGYGAPPPSAYGAPPPSYQQPPAVAAAAYGGQYGGGNGGAEMEVFYAAKNFMGRIIGQKGVTINDLQRRSACDIQVNQDVPPGQECEISIRGTRQGIEMVKQMLREIIDVGPNHPYAGGTQPGGGGGGGGGYQQQQGYGQAPQAYGGYQQQQQPSYGGHGGYDQQYQAAPYGRPAGGGHHAAQAAPYGQSAMGGYSAPHVYGHPQGAPAVQSEWKSATSPDGQVYYYNERTGETQWEKPIGMQ